MRFVVCFESIRILILFTLLSLTLSSSSAAPPAIPEFMGIGTDGVEANVSDARKKRAVENHLNAATAASGRVSDTHYGPGKMRKKKRNGDACDAFDDLLASRRNEGMSVVKMVGDLKTNLQGSPGKKRRDTLEQYNRLIIQYEQSAMNRKALELDNMAALEDMKRTLAERDQLNNQP